MAEGTLANAKNFLNSIPFNCDLFAYGGWPKICINCVISKLHGSFDCPLSRSPGICLMCFLNSGITKGCSVTVE